jgi:hypothetical protein
MDENMYFKLLQDNMNAISKRQEELFKKVYEIDVSVKSFNTVFDDIKKMNVDSRKMYAGFIATFIITIGSSLVLRLVL